MRSEFNQNPDFLSIFQIFVFVSLIAVASAAVSYADKHAKILTYKNSVNPDGSYHWKFESDNQIIAQEAGQGGIVAQGTAQWYAPEGNPIHLAYTADHDGYHPTGDHLPTPPPIPDAIVKLVAYLKQHAPSRPDEKL